jgi:hypothetical protein
MAAVLIEAGEHDVPVDIPAGLPIGSGSPKGI